MTSSYSPNSLSDIIQVATSAPFPVLNDKLSNASDVYKPSAFETSEKLEYCTDANGQPIVASIGQDKRLYLLYHVDHAPQAWQLVDVSPGSPQDVITAFDMACFGGRTYLAAAVKMASGFSKLYTCSLRVPKITYDSTSKKITPDLKQSLIWRLLPNNLGDKVITALRCGPTGPPLPADAKYQISVGTSETSTLAGSHYLVDTSKKNQQPWRVIPLPETTQKVLSIDAAYTYSGVGSFILYQRPDGIGCTQEVLDSSGRWSQPLGNIRMLTSSIGNAKSLTSHQNPEGQTDAFIAGTRGIAFYNGWNITKTPQVILNNISFDQVVSSEEVDPQNPDTQSILTIFAVSSEHELYHITGVRSFADNTLQFSSSGLPIRTDVSRLACSFNPVTAANELIYANASANTLHHLIKDGVKGTWNDSLICVPSTGKTYSYPAFVTSITCTDETGATAAVDYPISLTCDNVTAVINEHTFNLGSQPREVRTDDGGRVRVTIPADDSLGAPMLGLTLTQFLSKPLSFQFSPAQRVIRALAAMQSGQDILSSKASNGKAIFNSTASNDTGRAKADACAQFLRKLPDMVSHVDGDTAKQVLKVDPSKKSDFNVIIEKDDKGNLLVSTEKWFENAVDMVKKWVEDAIEWAKNAVKKVLRIGFRVVAGILEFAMEVAGRVVKFALTGIGHLLRSLVSFLKDTFGLDLSKLLAWLGFLFDVDEIKKTQNVIKNMAFAGMDLTQRFFAVNRPTFTNGFGKLRDMLQTVIKDTRPPVKTGDASALQTASSLSWLVQNPVVQDLFRLNPLLAFVELVGEAAEEELSDLVKLPNTSELMSIFKESIPDLAQQEYQNLERFISDVWDKIKNVLTNPQNAADTILGLIDDMAWTFFDAAKSLCMVAYDILVKLMKQAVILVSGVIKIPIITTFFEIFAEQDFSILNVVSFITAGIMNIYHKIKHDKLPFEVLPDLTSNISSIPDSVLDLGPLLGLGPSNVTLKSAPQPSTHQSISPQAKSFRPAGTSVPPKGATVLMAAGPEDGKGSGGSSSAEDEELRKKWKTTHAQFEIIPDVIGNLALALNCDVVIGHISLKHGHRVGGEKDGEGMSYVIQYGLDLAANFFMMAARVGDFVSYKICSEKSPKLYDEWGFAKNPTMATGYLLPLVMTPIPAFLNLGMRTDTCRKVSLMILAATDVVYNSCTVFTQHPGKVDNASAAMRVAGDGLGLVGLVADIYSEKDERAKFVSVPCSISAGVIMICALFNDVVHIDEVGKDD